MNNGTIILAEQTNDLLKSMNGLIEASINDIDNLQYEITFRIPDKFAMSKLDEFCVKRKLSKESSKYLLNELIKSTKIIEDALLEIGFKSSNKYASFNMVDSKEMDDIELRLRNIKSNGFFSTDSLNKIQELNKEIDDIESLMITMNRRHGEYAISKKGKLMFFKSSKSKFTFETVHCINERYIKFYDTLNSLSYGVYDSLKKEKAKLILEREELKA